MLALPGRISKLRVAVLPDFFLDRIVSMPSIRSFFKQVESKAVTGGGNLRGLFQTEVLGGNAGNLAFALSSLSVRTTYYCVGDAITTAILSQQRSACRLRVVEGKPGYTTALEFPFKGRRVNVMLSDVGDVINFDGRKLTRDDIKELRKCDCIALVNWSANRKGNELAKRVFSLEGHQTRLSFLDLADLRGAEQRLKFLLRSIISRGLLDVVSLNENEARTMVRLLAAGKLGKSYDSRDVVKACKMLHESLQTIVDVHTPIGSATSTGDGETWVPSWRTTRGVVTGAGDVWDAGDIIGHLLNLEDQYRLRFANACAYLYVTNRGGTRYPTARQVTGFLHSVGHY